MSAAAGAVDVDEVVRFAQALIEAPSENPGGTEDAAAAVACDIVSGFGAEPTVVRSDGRRPSVVATIGSGSRPSLVWNGHLDVVPAGSPGSWSSPPFRGTLANGRLVGRGAADMKGSIAAAFGALSAIRRTKIELGGTLDLHLAADEELAGVHGTRVLWERGFLHQDAAIVGEPTELAIALAERGGAWITATARGVAAHGSRPHLGVNAITSMSRFVLRLDEALPDRAHPLVGAPTVNAALISGGSAPNVVPDRCTVDIDRRILPGETQPEEVLAPFRALIARIRAEHPETDIDVEVREWTDAAEAPADSVVADLARRAVLDETGSLPPETGFTGITDARFYVNQAAIPAIILGPGSLASAHTVDEWVAIDELAAAARIYARIFVRFLGA